MLALAKGIATALNTNDYTEQSSWKLKRLVSKAAGGHRQPNTFLNLASLNFECSLEVDKMPTTASSHSRK